MFWPGGGDDALLFGAPEEANSSGPSLGPLGSLGGLDGVWVHYVTPGAAPAFFTDFINMVETQDGREILPAESVGYVPGAVFTDIYTLVMTHEGNLWIRNNGDEGVHEPVDYEIPLPTLQTLYTDFVYVSAQATVTTSAAGNGLLAASILVWDDNISQYKHFAYLAEFDLEGVIRENAVEAGHPLEEPHVFPGQNIVCMSWYSLISGSNVAANYSKFSIDSPTALNTTTYWSEGSNYSPLLICHDGFLVRRYNRSTYVTDAVACQPDGTVIRVIPLESPDDEYQYQGRSIARLVRYPVRTSDAASARVYDAVTDTLYADFDPSGTLRIWAFDTSYAHGLLTDDTAWPPLPGNVKQHYTVTANLLTGGWSVGELVYRTSRKSIETLPAVHAVEYARARAAG